MKTILSLSLVLFISSVALAIQPDPAEQADTHAKCYVKMADNQASFVIHVSNQQKPGIYTVVKTFANGKIEQVDVHQTEPHPEGKATWHSFIDAAPGCNPVNGVPYGYSLMRMDETGKAQIVTSWKYDPTVGEVSAL